MALMVAALYEPGGFEVAAPETEEVDGSQDCEAGPSMSCGKGGILKRETEGICRG
jgi:hypothetical protein